MTNEQFAMGCFIVFGGITVVTFIFTEIVLLCERMTKKKIYRKYPILVQAREEYNKAVSKSDSDWFDNCSDLDDKIQYLRKKLSLATDSERAALCEKIDRLEKDFRIAKANHEKFVENEKSAQKRYAEEIDKVTNGEKKKIKQLGYYGFDKQF